MELDAHAYLYTLDVVSPNYSQCAQHFHSLAIELGTAVKLTLSKSSSLT